MTEITEHPDLYDGYSEGLNLTLSVCLCYTSCVLGLRLYIRRKMFGMDDFIVALSTVLALAFFGCSYASKGEGLGEPTKPHSLDLSNTQQLNALYLASNISWIMALCLSKLAIVAMLLRTTATVSHQRLQYFVGALVSIQCVVSITLMTAECTSFRGLAWDFPSNVEACPGQALRWHIITGFDVATEVAILTLPLQLVWNLQMSSKNKLIVIVAFWLRIPTIVFTILRNLETGDLNSTADTSLTAAMIIIWQSIEMSYSITAATIAAAKRFTESLNTGFGHGELIRVHGQSQRYKLSICSASLKGSKISKSTIISETAPNHMIDTESATSDGCRAKPPKLRPDNIQNETTVLSMSQNSSRGGVTTQARGSGDKCIRQDVRYSVHYERED